MEGVCSSVAKIKPKAKKKVTAKKKAPAKLNPLDDPAALEAPLTPRSLGTQTQAATNLAYGGAEQDLAGQQRQADVTATSIPAWFKDYRDAQAHAEQATQQAYAGAVGAQQNATSSTYGLDTQNAQQVGAAQAATAASAGGVADPALQQKAQQAALSRRSAGDAATTLTAGLGAAQTAYRAGQSTVGAAQQLKAQLDQEGRRRDLGAKGTQLAKDKGNYAVTTRQKLIDSNHTKQLENKAFNLNQTKAEQDAAIKAAALAEKTNVDAARLGQTDTSLGISQQNADTASKRAEDAAAKAAAKTAAGKGRTAAEKNLDAHTKSDLDYTQTLIKQLQGAKVPVTDKDGKAVLNPDGSPKTKPAKLTSAQIRARLITGQGSGKAVDKTIVNAAYDLIVHGALSPANVKALHERGVSINSLGIKTMTQGIKAGATAGGLLKLKPKKKKP
jgi:hypothetical protein